MNVQGNCKFFSTGVTLGRRDGDLGLKDGLEDLYRSFPIFFSMVKLEFQD